ncbi:ABC transporter permease [Castellaniella hirudinis]|uniref:ABC transporter permease n=1 Tax=Castellaniella hirudinis TaxID=1144617 RepID=UPI0039C1D8C4
MSKQTLIPQESGRAGAFPQPQRTSALGGRVYTALLSLPPFIWQLLFLVLPVAFLFIITFWSVEFFRLKPDFTLANWAFIYSRAYFQDAYLLTFGLAALATAVISCLAFPCAYAIAFKLRPAARQLAFLLLILPFFTSYLVRIYAWQVVLADSGVINAVLGLFGLPAVTILNTLGGTLVGYATLCLPLVTLLQLLSLIYVDRNLIEAAHNLGCGRLETIWRVVIPSARIGIVIAALFCFILTFGDFVSPLYLGGGLQTMLSTVIIDTVKSGQQWPQAAVVAVTMILTLLAVALAGIWLAYRRTT